MRREVAYLGHVISDKGVQPNPKKTDSIQNFPTPKNQQDIKSFLGLVGYYRKFIGFAGIAKSLTILLKKDIQFEWTSDQQESFDKFRNILTTQPLLQYPDFNKEFLLTTDASNYAIGSVLSQGVIGKDLPIAYASRALSGSEQNYSTIEKELLAIIWSTNYFRPYFIWQEVYYNNRLSRPATWSLLLSNPLN